MSLLRRASLRHLTRHPAQLALLVLGVALGVAVVVAIDLANTSARRAFTLSVDSVAGRATHQIETTRSGLPEDLYRALRVDLGLRLVAPVVEGTVTAEPTDAADGATGEVRGVTLRLLGIDPFAEAPFRAPLGGIFRGGVGVDEFLTKPRTAVISIASARALGVTSGDEIRLRIGTRLDTVRLVGTLAPEDEREASALGDLLVTDIATAQELLDRRGRLDRIDLIVAEGDEGTRKLREVETLLPPGATLRESGGRTRTMLTMTRAFRLNLSALSLLALVVGMFLIYNATTFAVVQRRAMLGRLRALGVTRREIFAIILGEAALVGALGTVLGLVLGVALGQGLVALVTRTINDLYFVVSVRALAFDPLVMAKGIALGVGATVLAALVPAAEAASATPRLAMGRSSLEERWRRQAPRAALLGAALAVLGALVIALSERSIVLSFVGFFGLVAGSALTAPFVTVGLMIAIRPLARLAGGVIGAMAARGVVSALSRTGVAVSALMVAVSVTVGVGIMVDSFRETVIRWLGSQLQADVYISPPDLSVGRADPSLDPALVARLAAMPGVRDRTTIRRADVEEDGVITRLIALSLGARTEPALPLVEGDTERAWRLFRAGEAVLVSQPFSWRRQVGVGDAITLATDRGPRDFEIAGVYEDYASEHGVIAIERQAYERHWDDRGISGLALFLEPGIDADDAVAEARARAGRDQQVLIQSTRAIREQSLEIFERTFTITAVLRLLAVFVAFTGVLAALMALELERARELGVLRATGLTPGQLWRLVLTQTGFMGLAAGLFSLPLGVLLASVMIHVINVRSFGWTLDMTLDPSLLAQAVLVSVSASLLAGLYPAWRMSRTSPALALREE